MHEEDGIHGGSRDIVFIFGTRWVGESNSAP